MNYSLKRSRYDSPYCREFERVVSSHVSDLRTIPYFPTGSDERQFSSPNVRIPSISLCRNRYYEYDEYHSSLDDLVFMDINSVEESINILCQSIEYLDQNLRVPLITNEIGEPHLKHYGISFHPGGLYRPSSKTSSLNEKEIFFLMYSMSDGTLSLEEIFTDLCSRYDIHENSLKQALSTLTSNKIASL